MKKYGPDVASFMLAVGWKWWYVVGPYIPPNDHPEVRRLEQSLVRCPAHTEILLVGDLNDRVA